MKNQKTTRGKKRSQKAGLPPGSLVYLGERPDETVKITVIDYNDQYYEEKQVKSVDQCAPFRSSPTVTWLNIDGVGDVPVIEKLGEQYGLHPLMLEDILNTSQRPKFEDFGSYFFIVLKMLTYDEQNEKVNSEQISMIMGDNFLISFQETAGDVFDHVRDRLRNSKGRIRKMGVDFLAYSLMDAIVDNYFVILEKLGERIEKLEEQLMESPDEQMPRRIHDLKTELISLRKSVWPLRELINGLYKSESGLMQKTTSVYLRDVYDHTIQILDTIESSRDMVSSMHDIYLSSINNRLNSVMKVLTIIATIFMPLSFFTGVYGMNFRHMPELERWWMYPYGFWLVIAITSGIMLMYFRKKKWL